MQEPEIVQPLETVEAPAIVQQVPAPEPPKKSTIVKEGKKARRFKYARRQEGSTVQEPSAAPEPPRFLATVQEPPTAPEPTTLCAKIVQRPDVVSPFKIQQVHRFEASNSLPEKIVSEFYDSLPASQREP